MRGVQFAILTLFWLIAMAMIIASMQLAPALRQGKTQEALIKTDVYMMSSAMDAAESYMKAGLQFSGYQACYDILKNGGNAALTSTNKISYGGADYGIVPDRMTFMSSLKGGIQDYLNKYSGNGYSLGYSDGKKYLVNIPQYSVSITETSGSISASATPAGKMSSTTDVKGGNLNPDQSNIKGQVVISKSANIQGDLKENCATYFDVMKKSSDDMKTSLNNIMQNEITKTAAGISKTAQIDCTKVKDEELAAMKSEIAKLSSADRPVELLYANLDLTLITPPEPVKNGDVVTSYVCRFSNGGKSGIAVKATVPGKDKFPVFNGKALSFETTNAVFAVKVGSDQAVATSQPSTQPSQTDSTQLPAASGKTSWFASDAGDSCRAGSQQYGCGQGSCPVGSWAHTAACNNLCLGDTYSQGGGPSDVNVWYAAMRWTSPSIFWCGKKIVVTNSANGKQVVVAIEDKGPSASFPDRAVDLSKKAYDAIGANENSIVTITFADAGTPLGSVA